jgi:endonuclease YncB( thermonuclease family)
MLKLGMASYYNRKKSSPKEYLDAEDEAKKSKKGIWSKEHESPASFRKRTKAPRKK